MAGTHRSEKSRWGAGTWALIAGASLVLVAGAAVVVGYLVGRPQVSLTSSSSALANVNVKGAGAKLTGASAVVGGKRIALVQRGSGLWPAQNVAQGETVQLSATVSPAGWLSWLVGGPVTASTTIQTPVARPASTTALTTSAGRVPVRFDAAVDVVSYAAAGGKPTVVHLSQPSRSVDLAVPAGTAAGSLDVSASPRSWEALPATTASLTWFTAPAGGGPALLTSPPPGATNASSLQPISLTFSTTVAQAIGTTRPTVSPSVPGSWSETSPNTLVFTPTGVGFAPATTVTVGFDKAVSVMGSGSNASTTRSYTYTTSPGSILRMQQILARLHYLPLRFTPSAAASQPSTLAADYATIDKPLAGTFAWRYANTPAALQAQWAPGSANVMVKGALMAFISTQGNYSGYTLDAESVAQMATAQVWSELLKADVAHQIDPAAYAYVYVTKTLPETMTLWDNGTTTLTASVNTGIPQDPTADGTFPVYLRLTHQIMRGTNPNGSHYADPVSWINYFNGSDAVHGFVRASYGFPQSLGCVELPPATAKSIFPDLAIGDLVTVAG